MDERQKSALNAVKSLAREHGLTCMFSVDAISEICGIPSIELWDWDNDGGVLQELSDLGEIVTNRGADPAFALDSKYDF